MPDTGNGAPGAPTDAQTAEQKMRRALGLTGNTRSPSFTNAANGGAGGASHGNQARSGQPRTPQQRPDQARQRHRFVQDGGVPVVVVNHRAEDSSVLKERVTELERQLETERAQHANTRRALQEAQATTQAIETRLVHAGLAHQEALNQERRALANAQQRLNEAQAQLHTAGRRRTAPEAVPAPVPEIAAARAEAAAEPAQDLSEEPLPARVPSMTAAEGGAVEPQKKRGRPRTRPLPEPKPVRWWTPSFRAKTKG